MPKLKIRNFKGLNTVYDSADIDIEFFTEYKNICTKYGYIIPEVVTIEKFKEINNLVHIQEIYLDNDKLANKLVGDGYWAKSESDYIQDIKKYLLVVENEFIKIFDNVSSKLLATYDYESNINIVKVFNSKGKAKIVINDKDIYIIQFVKREYRYSRFEKSINGLYILPIINNYKQNFDIGINSYSMTQQVPYTNEQTLENEVYIPSIRNYYKLKDNSNYPFNGLNLLHKPNDYSQFNIALFIKYPGEGIDYAMLKGKKYKIIDNDDNSIYSANQDMLITGLACPNTDEVGFIEYKFGGKTFYCIRESTFSKIVSQSYINTMVSKSQCYRVTQKLTFPNKLPIDDPNPDGNYYYWTYKTETTVDYKYGTAKEWQYIYEIEDTFIKFDGIEQLNSFIKLVNSGTIEDVFYINKLVDIDADGFNDKSINNIEIVITNVSNDINENVIFYQKTSLTNYLSKFVLTLNIDNLNIISYFKKDINKIYFYFRTNNTDDFEQFGQIDFQSKNRDFNDTFLLSLNTRTGVYLAQTIGYAYLPTDYETNVSNKALIKPNSILDVNGIQMGLWGQNIVYPAVGRGKILEDIYYKFNIVPDVEGDWLVNISNTLGVYNIDRRELYLLDVRNQENVLLFYLKESVPYVINKYDDIIYTPIGVIIMTNKGIILFDGKQNTLLSQNINNLVEDNYKTSNIFYDKLNQHLHFINTRWYRYDFQMQVWNEFEIPEYKGDKILPQKLINYNNRLLVKNNNTLYILTYDNNSIGNLTLVKFQNAQDNVKIKINDITYDEDTPLGRIITKEFITLKNRKYKDYLEFSTNVKDKLYSLELDVDMIELDNMKLQYPLR